ncbi:OpcA protein [Propionibacterium sp. NM47_B9-13]|jgi:glucose-6-phosphate dehydrogenase assembly protein OpcA|uniref:Glucose-6-phosphate dehydrogenase assembly protein OpcA n=2 Tax=Cutibacterium modestum TaxID=2559073 RepID=A0AAD1KPP1_9ACTN|nr:glucose-6-phosphate dehydrogenase assembly protein OpcA [Cutibacterium modestum]TGY27881.1 OpcA protein [Propionibacterium sp. NM47_B9-13]AOH46278.1 OpcA protein [Cutibacterium modestum]EFS74452.1 putative opcA protein [Cutibacterium modestum HL037PA2]EFS93686.1 putative opcA protein [Cutibacterium modestum HL044PA1]EFT16380.1 putative opcA protein [Cutibacterium modestum HL037PA3]
MIVTLSDTTASTIGAAIVEARRTVGSGSGLVHTLICICDSSHFDAAFDAARDAARQHPSRLLMVVTTRSRKDKLDAEVHAGEGTPGDVIVLRLSGAMAKRPASVILPLLLPDSPVIAWWPFSGPDDLASDPIGALADRRITDSAADKDPCKALTRRAAHLTEGDSDLCWARTTGWRALAAAALDQHPVTVKFARVESAADNAPAMLLAAWLGLRLGVQVERAASDAPGISAIIMATAGGDIEIRRRSGRYAVYRIPGEPARGVALDRRNVQMLIGEELRRLGPDDAFTTVMAEIHDGADRISSTSDEDGS